jgi:RimJ/RimL family protein N-acetyltransferase
MSGVSSIFLTGDRLVLRSIVPEDATESYLGWLNDPEVLRFRGPKAFPSSMADLRRYLDSAPDRGDLHLAVCERVGERHIGNVSLNNILWVHRSAELSIMLGARDAWGKGYGGEAMALLADHAFRSMGLNRVWAESPNPAFNAAVRRLGWTHEGTKREAFLLDGRFVDIECFAILAREYFQRNQP